jgi:hypothetical protein
MLPILMLQKELSNLAQNIDLQTPDLGQDPSALQDLQSEVSSQLQLYHQANTASFGSIRRGESFSPKQQLTNSLPSFPNVNPGNSQYNSRQSIESSKHYGSLPVSTNLPAYGSQGKTIAEAELGVKFSEEISGQGDWGSGHLKGELFIGARARVFGDMDWEKRNMYVGFEAEVGARAHFDGGYRTPTGPAGAEFGASGDAFTGVAARGTAELSFNENAPRIALGGEAFQGSKAGLDVGTGLTIDGNRAVGGHYGVEAWNGIGAGVNTDLGFKDGNFRFDFSGGLALAIGAEVSFGFDIGFGDLFRSTTRIGEDLLNDVGNAAKNVGKEVEKTVSSTAKDVAKGAETVVKDVGKSVDKVISSIF